jgi:hypothetical protein
MKRLLSLAWIVAAAGWSAAAQTPAPPLGGVQAPLQDDGGDAPDHGVARLSLMNGNVSVAHGDSGDLTAAAVNAPLVATDRVMTAENSRAEVQFDSYNMVRLAPMTEVRLGELQYKRYLVQVAQGTVTFRVLRDSDAQVEISTPNSSLHPVRQGIYRITVHGDGTSEITVRDGEADVYSPTGSEPLHAGATMMSRGPANDPEFRTVGAIAFDDWDRWNSDRDRAFDRITELSRYASPDIYGTEELANHGRWVWDPAYGYVWVPDVNGDWAPYRDGRWSYIDYYGWSWVSYDPWGWAPYHYGRWYRGNLGWAWYPGPLASRYYWHPAQVGFFGWGSPGFGMSVGFGFGNVGWVPLAPHEPFRPWYGRNVYANRVNVMNNVNVVNVYRNAQFTGGVTSVHAADFGRTSIDGRNFIRGNPGDFSRAGMINGSVPIAPSREGRQFVSRDVNPQAFPRTSGNTNFFNARPGATGTGFNAGGNPGLNQGNVGERGGWRRIDSGSQSTGFGGGGAGPSAGSASPRFQGGTVRDLSREGARTNQGFSGGGNPGGFSAVPRAQEPVQIRPPIVTNRNSFGNSGAEQGRAFPNQAPPPSSNSGGFGNFGGPRRTIESRPPAYSAPQGGQRGGGGGGHPSGGGNRGGGGGGNRGGGRGR